MKWTTTQKWFRGKTYDFPLFFPLWLINDHAFSTIAHAFVLSVIPLWTAVNRDIIIMKSEGKVQIKNKQNNIQTLDFAVLRGQN